MKIYTLILNVSPAAPGGGKQADAEFEILVADANDMRSLLKTHWEIAEFREWIAENLNQILREPLPYYFGKEESIAKCVSSFYESVNPEDDDLVDSAFDYRRAHGIRFGLRGARIPDIYIGMREGSLEISCFSRQEEWAYFIYADLFEIEMKKLLRDR